MLKLPNNVRAALHFFTDILPKVPTRNDDWLTIGVKLLSVLDSLQSTGIRGGNVIGAFVEQMGLQEQVSEQFVTMFFATQLREKFTIRKYALDDYSILVEATSQEFGTLYFTEYGGHSSNYSDGFYFTQGFDFEKLLDVLWSLNEGRIHVSLKRESWKLKSTFSTFSIPTDPIFGSAVEVLDRTVAKHSRYQEAGHTRTYLLVGGPGTGKSNFAKRFADRLGKRTLILGSESLAQVNEQEIGFLIQGLKPEFIILDDIDKAPMDKVLPTILSILERFKTDHPGTTVVLTANDPEKLDEALRRPGRVDRIIKFDLPSTEEKREILLGYLGDTRLPEQDIHTILTRTEGMSPSYLKEIALLIQHEGVEDTLEAIDLLREIAMKKTGEVKNNATVLKDAIPKA